MDRLHYVAVDPIGKDRLDAACALLVFYFINYILVQIMNLSFGLSCPLWNNKFGHIFDYVHSVTYIGKMCDLKETTTWTVFNQYLCMSLLYLFIVECCRDLIWSLFITEGVLWGWSDLKLWSLTWPDFCKIGLNLFWHLSVHLRGREALCFWFAFPTTPPNILAFGWN